MPCAKTWLCLALYYLVEESELDSFVRFHPFVAVAERLDLINRLTAVLRQHLIEVLLEVLHLFEVDGLVLEGRVADAGTGLVDHEPRVGKCHTVTFLAARSNHGTHAGCQTQNRRIDRRFDEFHHRDQLQTRVALAALRVDVQVNRIVVHRVQE